jgi:UDP:flavonoid glycosyltransferase YjiC (YdhE family)
MVFELPHPESELPPGEGPLVLVASSTAQDPESRLVRWALEALADEPVRVLSATNRSPSEGEFDAPANAVVVDWVSYSQVMSQASLVICHGGHGTVARALGAGAPLLVCPPIGDMTENAIRVAWSGTGLALPWRLCRPGPLQWAARRVLGGGDFSNRAADLAAWSRDHNGAGRGAERVERYARA